MSCDPFQDLFELFAAKLRRPSISYTASFAVPAIAFSIIRYGNHGAALIPALVGLLVALASLEFGVKWLVRRIDLKTAWKECRRLVQIVRDVVSTLQLEPESAQWSPAQSAAFHQAIDSAASRDQFLYGLMIAVDGKNHLESPYLDRALAGVRETWSCSR